IGIELDLDDQTACIECDPDQLTQMLMNICLNSIDAITDKGTITIATGNVLPDDAEFSCESGLTPAAHVRIEVTDNGTGMDAETQRRAFEPFFTTKDVGRGTGLGLSTVYGAVRELGGRVRIFSELHAGTTVRMLLPACTSARTRRSSFPARAGANVPMGTVLVVDDEPLVRLSFARMLEGLGWRVMVADGGPSALELYRANADQIDVVLLDLSMPVMDGAQCFAELRQIDPAVRVALCTGHARAEAAQRFVAGDLPRLVTKPCSPEELAEALGEALQMGPRILHMG
ncbi:MAG: response regulator, partial [Polyangiaceae bacterium]|nr:response regulator [Polyangiaceae bacterium]